MKKKESEGGKVLTRKDINRLAFRTLFLQAGMNYQRMQATGFLWTQLPALQKIYKDDPEGLSAAMTDNLEFINTHPNLVGFLNGLLISMEESHEDREIIKGLKVALFAPLAGIGDAIFWFTLLPILAGICASLAMDGNVLGPIAFFAVYLVIFILRWFWTHLGYDLGVKAVAKITAISDILARAATVLGVTVIGGLIATNVNITVLSTITVSASNVVSLQSDFFDMLFPNILPFGYVFLMYFFLTKKKASPVVLILITIVLAVLLSFLGVL